MSSQRVVLYPSQGSTRSQNSLQPISHPHDIGLDDEDLIELPVKQLNSILKSNNISKERAKSLKLRRRKLLNRGNFHIE